MALNLMHRIFLNFAKSCILSFLPKFHIKKNVTLSFLKYKYLKLKLSVFLAGHTVAMVTYSVMKMILTCSPLIGQFFDDHDCRLYQSIKSGHIKIYVLESAGNCFEPH